MRIKLLTGIIILFLSLPAGAQFEKGMRMAGASIAWGNISSGTTDYSAPNQLTSSVTNNTVSIGISPSLGWFRNERTVADLSFLINYSSQKLRRSVGGITDKKDNYTNLDYGLGGFIRYYFKTGQKILPFLHGYLNAGTGSTKTDGVYYTVGSGGTDKSTYQGKSSGRFFYNAGLNAGITRMLNANVGLDAFIGYGFSSTKFTTKTSQITDYASPSAPDTKSEYELSQNFTGNTLNIGLGFVIFLNKPKN